MTNKSEPKATTVRAALAKFKEGYNCAQSVLHSFAPGLSFDRDTALRIANGFGGGMGRKQEVCGAVSGGIMVLGLAFGRGEGEGREKHENTYAKTRELLDAFRKTYGSVNCRELLGGCDLMTPAGRKMRRTVTAHGPCRGNCARFIPQIQWAFPREVPPKPMPA